jgi:hypothetical protein
MTKRAILFVGAVHQRHHRARHDTIVFVASQLRPQENRPLMNFVAALNSKHINVSYELVNPTQNDCSLSNYAALTDVPHYVNLEVVETDGKTQRKMVNVVLGELGIRRLAF